MQDGQQRFLIQIDKISQLLQNAKNKRAPIYWLYQNNFRTTLFMLEGLAKVYASMHDKNHFEKIFKKSKALEDAFGAYDYYYSYHQSYKSNDKIPKSVLQYFQLQLSNKKELIQQLLEDDLWWSGERIEKLKKRLQKVKWQSNKKEVTLLQASYKAQVKKIRSFMQSSLPYTDIELHVHELRRKLRWLSIYPQAMNGLIALDSTSDIAPAIKKYQTKAIIESPFNQFQPNPDLKHHLLLDNAAFLSLSWMIATIGDLKDSGLERFALTEAIHAKQLQAEKDKILKNILGKNSKDMGSILAKASQLSETFIQDEVLNQLLVK